MDALNSHAKALWRNAIDPDLNHKEHEEHKGSQ
jgi:hypothetical protein